MKNTVTLAAVDRRLARPSELVAIEASLTTALARTYLDRASAMIAGRQGLRYAPWRQSYVQRLQGSNFDTLRLHAKPVESVSVADVDGAEVAVTDYEVGSNELGIADRLERDAGWRKRFGAGIGISNLADPDTELDAWVVTLTAGWLMPGQVSTWSPATAYQAEIATTSSDDPSTQAAYDVGSWVRSRDPRVVLRFECSTAGTTGATEPVEFSAAGTVVGTVVADGTVEWTARAAQELPADLEQEALRLALWVYEKQDETREIKSMATGEATESVSYGPPNAAVSIPTDISSTLESYR